MTLPSEEFLIAGDAMFGTHPLELFVVAIATLILFSRRLPRVLRQRGIDISDKRWEDTDVKFLKLIVLALVSLLCFAIMNSRLVSIVVIRCSEPILG